MSFKISNEISRQFLGEFAGTFTLVCLGLCGNAVLTVSKAESAGSMVGPFVWGMALTVAIHVCGGVSGGHVNPAVSLGLASVGKLPWKRLGVYVIAQFLGAFVAALVTLLVYHESIYKLPYSETMGIFGTFPQVGTGTLTAFIDQMVGTAFFLFLICAIIDKKNMAVSKELIPLLIGFANLGVLCVSFGYNCGTPLNPARDFSPRLMTAMLGWEAEPFRANDYYFWVPLVACSIGGIIGCWAYKLLIENNWPEEKDLNINVQMKNRDSTGPDGIKLNN